MNTPGFPERLGEVVIEAVHHTGKTPGQHIVLEVLGCTACENDYEDHVEWGGMLSMDETRSHRKMYNSMKLDNFGHQHRSIGDRTPIVESLIENVQGYPRIYDFQSTPATKQKYLKQFQYKYSSFRFDQQILDEVEKLAKEAVSENTTVDASFVCKHQKEELAILKELRGQEKHIPFNHKLEQMHMYIYICSEQGDGLVCPPTPAETSIVHDGA